MMDWSAAQDLADAGITLGGHTVSHARLPTLDADEARREIVDCAKIISDRTGYRVEQFAYPYGLLSVSVRDIVEDAGYRLACSTRTGFNNEDTHAFEIRRLEVMGNDDVGALRRKICFGTNDGSYRNILRYYGRRLQARLRD